MSQLIEFPKVPAFVFLSSVFATQGALANPQFETGADCAPPYGGSPCDPRLMCSPEERARQYAERNGWNTACQRTVLPHSTAAGVTVAAGAANVLIALNCQIRICPDQFVVSPSIAPFFAINDILFGNERQLGGAAPVAADQFPPDGTFPLKGDCLTPGMIVTLDVTNLDGVNPHPFFSHFAGSQLRG